MTEDLIPEIPEELKEAQQKGKLVIFAGSGVSSPKPSELPTYSELCNKIEDKYEELRQANETIDEFLGRMKKQGNNVHQDIAEIIGNRQSRPNELHYTITKLFNKKDELRIVTTNYDTHFSTILKQDNVKILYPPNIGLGIRFNGLVYLHGCIEDNIKELIITNADIGRAYCHEKFASYFLENIFNEYTILFIGYSMHDPMTSYQYFGLPLKKWTHS